MPIPGDEGFEVGFETHVSIVVLFALDKDIQRPMAYVGLWQ